MYRSGKNLLKSVVKKVETSYQILKYVNGLTKVLSSSSINSFSNVTPVRFSHALPELTKDRYPHVKRGNFNQLTSEDLQFFKTILGESGVLTDEFDVADFNVDWLKMVRGYSNAVLKPRTTEQLSKIIKYCNERRLAVCPQGGNTGLVGGSVPVFDEVIISTALMNKIFHLDQLTGVLTCQSGCILEMLEIYLNEHGFIMPLDLGAKGSCQIGGNVSTNAGGIRLLRYGSLHGNILGLEVVLANGEVLDLLSTLKKDNTGYHLKHLFIGSEGTLGIVTKIAIQCPPAPKSIHVAFLGLKDFKDVLKTFQSARSDLGEILSSCEVIDHLSLDVSLRNLEKQNPLQTDYPFYMLIETRGSDTSHDEEKLNAFLDKIMDSKTVLNGILTNETFKIDQLWQIRERIAEGLLKDGHCYKYDISLPLTSFYELVEVMRKRLKGTPAKIISGYGHVGDGNLHLNITSKEYDPELTKLIEPFIFEWTQKLRGSVSAEHGIGFKKTQYLHFSKPEASISVMKDIKKMFDPNGILNPYKVLPLS